MCAAQVQSEGKKVIRALRVIWLALKDLFDEFGLLLLVNLIWSALCLPLIAASLASFRGGLLELGILCAALAGLPLSLASTALCAVTDRVSQGIVSSTRQFFGFMRQYALVSMKLFGLWYLGLLLILVDIWFYVGIGGLLGATLTIFWIYMLIVWQGLLIYLLPLLISQGDIGLLRLWRSAAGLAFGRPLFTLTLLTVLGVVLLASLFLPLLPILVVLLLAVFFALVGTRATRTLLAEIEAEREAALEASAPASEVRERGRRGQVRPRE